MICEYNAECTKDAYAIVRELAQDQSTLSETPACPQCIRAWMEAETDRWVNDELQCCDPLSGKVTGGVCELEPRIAEWLQS